MIDYVARALAQKALSQSGGGTSINTYSQEEIDALFIQNKEETLKFVEQEVTSALTDPVIVEEITKQVADDAVEKVSESIITTDDKLILDGGVLN